MPMLDLAQRRRDTAKDADNQTTHHRQQRPVLSFRYHTNAARETIYTVEIQQVGGEYEAEGHERCCKDSEADAKV